MKRIALIVLWAAVAQSEDIYVSQSGAGGETGADCANAKSLTWLNTASSWAAGAGKISSGDTVHLCGTFTADADGGLWTTFGLGGVGGVVGSPVTVLLETDAVLQAPYFNRYKGGACLRDCHDIILDGGVNGIIRNTDCGSTNSGLTYHAVYTCGIYLNGATNIEIRNLSVSNIFLNAGGHLSNASDTSGEHTYGLYSRSGTNYSIHNCSFSSARCNLMFDPSGSFYDTVQIYSNILSDACWHISFGSGTESATGVTNLWVYNNDFSNWRNWWYPGGPGSIAQGFEDLYHTDGVIFYANSSASSSYVSGKIYGNKFHGDLGRGSPTAYISLGWSSFNWLVYNNVLDAETNDNVAIWINTTNASYKLPINIGIYNNTILGCTNFPTSGGNKWAVVVGGGDGVVLTNNIFQNYQWAYRKDNAAMLSDFNLFDNITTPARTNNAGTVSWATWATLGQDAASVSNAITFRPEGRLTAVSPAINAGTDLSGYFTTDRDGVTRSGVWDIGAYEYTAPLDPTLPRATFGGRARISNMKH